MKQFGREQGRDGVVNGRFVVKRLAHPHEDDVASLRLSACIRSLAMHDLIENLGGGQVFGDAHLAGRTKSARCSAAHL